MKKNLFFIVWICALGLLHNTKTYAQLNTVYKTGEKLTYLLEYGFIDAGTATLTLEQVKYNDQFVHYAKAEARTVGLADKLFYVRDTYSSYFDIATCKPMKAISDIREGPRYKRYYEDIFDHNNNTVTNVDKKLFKVPANTFDMVSVFYYCRRGVFQNLKEGDVIAFDTFFHNDPWKLVVRFEGYEDVDLDMGEMNCLKFKPVVEPGNFKDADALTIWISNDKNYLPVRIEMDLFLGSFGAELVEYSGLLNPITVED